jgi:hypothetical protein
MGREGLSSRFPRAQCSEAGSERQPFSPAAPSLPFLRFSSTPFRMGSRNHSQLKARYLAYLRD